MSDFKQVSLGFAEFVGQLLTETFEASINAQQYQIQRYTEFESILAKSDAQFLLDHIDGQAIVDREIEIAGAPIARQMELTDEQQAYILELTEAFEDHSIIYQNRLTNYGFESLRTVIDQMMIDEQRQLVRSLLERIEQTRLVVDSGEINAKLELTSLVESSSQTEHDSHHTASESDTVKAKRLSPDASVISTEKEVSLNEFTLSSDFKSYIDPITKEETLLIDKASLQKDTALKLEPLRLKAKPLPSSTNSQIFSEVSIRFKTV